MKRFILIAGLTVLFATVYAQTPKEKGLEAITETAVKGQLEFLASDWTEGRAVGSKGAYLAADYIASLFKIYGIEPFGDMDITRPTRTERMQGAAPENFRTYYQNFGLLQYSPGEEQQLTLVSKNKNSENTIEFQSKTDFDVRTGTVGQSAQAPIVFAGYGFKDEEGTYNDIKKLDLEGKIAVVLEGFPGHRETSSVGYKKFKPIGRYARYYLERNKTENLKKAGAIAVIHVTPETDQSVMWANNKIYPVKGDYYEADERLVSYYDFRMTLPGDTLETDLPVFMVTPRVANEIIAGTGINFKAFEEQVATDLKPASQALEGKFIAFKTTVNSEIVKARNVLGYIEGKKKDKFIVVGAHYDHVGKWNGWIWNGADDNASGTVGVMTIAKAFKATGEKPEKSIIFAAWTGEEKGLWGSKYFVQQAKKNDLDIVVKLNYDMIGRDTEKDSLKNQASMVYTKANSKIEDITKENLDNFDINLDLHYRPSERPRGGSDHSPFANAGIPIFYFMAAMHPDYHLPSDELSKINWEKMQNIIRIGFLNTWDFANSDAFLEVEENVVENEK
ncbi:MAG TPA: M20/M25/M40 family metallo-hydrolase [Prolixibacteraceae bacterium]|nr:M20/M25/M40 family metallo-hydrolase [Prolixibacteraceae bacterium]